MRAASDATENGVFSVLVVDDNSVDQELAAKYISMAWPFHRKLQLDFAADGREALAKVRARSYSLIILDWRLPVMGEGETLCQLRQQGAQTPVVVLSCMAREEILADLDRLCAGYLHKDLMNPKTFHNAIGHALALVSDAQGGATKRSAQV